MLLSLVSIIITTRVYRFNDISRRTSVSVYGSIFKNWPEERFMVENDALVLSSILKGMCAISVATFALQKTVLVPSFSKNTSNGARCLFYYYLFMRD